MTLKRARQYVTLNPVPSSSSGSPLKRKRPTPAEEDAAWDGWHDVRSKDLDTAAVHINRHGWLELDWAKGIDDLITQAAEAGEEDGIDQDGDSETQGPIQIRRTDTMLQERYDYLSEGKKEEYEVWKEGILSRIKKLQARPPPAMTAGMEFAMVGRYIWFICGLPLLKRLHYPSLNPSQRSSQGAGGLVTS